MTSMSDLVKGLKFVSTNKQAQSVITEAMAEVRRAQRTGEIPTDLRNSARELTDLSRALTRAHNEGRDVAALFAARKNVVIKAYVNVAGATGAFRARNAVSLADEFARSAKDVGEGIAIAAKKTTSAIGDTAGSLLGGLLKGLGPLVVAVLAFVVWTKYFKGRK